MQAISFVYSIVASVFRITAHRFSALDARRFTDESMKVRVWREMLERRTAKLSEMKLLRPHSVFHPVYCSLRSSCYHSRMHFPALKKWLLSCGAVVCGVGIGLFFKAESSSSDFILGRDLIICGLSLVFAGLLAISLGAVVWAIQTTTKKCLIAALCTAAGGAFIALFGGINRNGDSAILIPVVLAAGLITFLLAVIALNHYLKPRIGTYAYLVTALLIVVAGTALFVNIQMEGPSKGPPKVVAVAKISKLIAGLPKGAGFELTGLSFYDGELFVGTNLGLVEVSGEKPVRLYQFQSSDSVVSGPWLDRADHLLWATDDRVHGLLRFDGSKWARMEAPVPAKGYYTRGDVLEGLQPNGNSKGFWLCAGGTTWRWNGGSAEWEQIPLPDLLDFSTTAEIVGVLPISEDPLLIVRKQMLAFLTHEDDFVSDEVVNSGNPTGTQLPRDGKPFLADSWTVSADAGYICTRAQKLIRVTEERVAPLETPGACEAVASDENLNLIVSIKTKGVFRYARGQWTLIAESPYPSGAGDYWIHLSASSGQLALAIEAQPVVDPHYSDTMHMHFVKNAPTGLWVLKDGKFALVDF